MIEFFSYNYPDPTLVDLDFRNKTVFWDDCINQDYAATVFARCGMPNILINTAHPEPPRQVTCEYYYYPSLFTRIGSELINAKQFEFDTSRCFNFVINNSSVSRFLLIKLVEFYKLNSYLYTWSGSGRRTLFDFESNRAATDLQEFLQKPINMSACFETDNGAVDLSQDSYELMHINCVKEVSGAWLNNWNKYIGHKMSSTAVSLISETDKQFDTINFTEKTFFSLLGLTFPIWIGGKHQAQQWADLGFDIYNDVIDHSYQHADTLLDRATIAFESNQRLLQDIDWATALRNKHLSRLVYNRSNMFNIIPKIVDHNYQKICNSLPAQDAEYFKSSRRISVK